MHAAGGSAARLVDLTAAAFPGYRDCALYRLGLPEWWLLSEKEPMLATAQQLHACR